MSNFEKVPASELAAGDWVLLKGKLSRVASVSGMKVTTDRGHIGDTWVRGTRELSRIKDGADVEEAARIIHANMHPGTKHLGAAQVAEEIGVGRAAVTASLRRHGLTSARPFPRPAVYIGDVPGWTPSQVGDIRAWFEQPAKGRRRQTSAPSSE